MRYDVIVVGAGPAGSTTARECASRGLSVLLLDKAEFPRDKPCGGGVTIRAADLLPFELTPVIERVVSRARFTERQSRGFTRSFPDKLSYLTQRSRLDMFLAERAVEAGAAFRQREGVRQIERSPGHVVVHANGHAHEGRTLVAADGANGVTSRLAGLDVRLTHGIALEGNISPAGGIPAEWQETMGFDMGGMPGGYGWLFPKGDHVNIGLGGWRHIGPTLRGSLNDLVRFYGFEPSDLWGVRGHHLPIRQVGSALAEENVLAVGDAAGLIDPFTGEGIFAGISSGRLAAEQLTAYLGGEVSDLRGYKRGIENTLLPQLNAARRIRDVFHMWPGLFLGIDRRTTILWPYIARLLRGEADYLRVKAKLGPLWPVVEFVSDLLRVTPLGRIADLRDHVPTERFFRRAKAPL